ncbi:unnamed protein product, partial [Prorocentrum cordatum]
MSRCEAASTLGEGGASASSSSRRCGFSQTLRAVDLGVVKLCGACLLEIGDDGGTAEERLRKGQDMRGLRRQMKRLAREAKNDDELLAVLDCCHPRHIFHVSCIARWAERENSCPQCKQRFSEYAVYGQELQLSRVAAVAERRPAAAGQPCGKGSPGDAEEFEGDDEACRLCNSADDEAAMLLCDGRNGLCNAPYHYYCLGLQSIPEGAWYCPPCHAALLTGKGPETGHNRSRSPSPALPAGAGSSDDESESQAVDPSWSEDEKRALREAPGESQLPRRAEGEGEEEEAEEEASLASVAEQDLQGVGDAELHPEGEFRVPPEVLEQTEDTDEESSSEEMTSSNEPARKRRRRTPRLKENACITVRKSFMSNSLDSVKLRRGLTGLVYKMDRHGDALVEFDDHPKPEWIRQHNFHRLCVKRGRPPARRRQQPDSSAADRMDIEGVPAAPGRRRKRGQRQADAPPPRGRGRAR